MNLKLAKMLRRMAKDAHATMKPNDPVGEYRINNKTGEIRNVQNSLRGVYRRLKKEPRVRAFAYSFNAEQRQLRAVQKLPQEGGLQ